MARTIDFSKPLSADDAAYAADRPWLLQDAELSGVEVQTEDEFVVEGEATPGETEDVPDEDVVVQAALEEDGEPEPYEAWEYAELKAEAKARQLTTSGSKEQLIARLTEDDATE